MSKNSKAPQQKPKTISQEQEKSLQQTLAETKEMEEKMTSMLAQLEAVLGPLGGDKLSAATAAGLALDVQRKDPSGASSSSSADDSEPSQPAAASSSSSSASASLADQYNSSFNSPLDISGSAVTGPEDSFGPCNFCGEPANAVCARCKMIAYCGKNHQVEDWKEHKKYCKKYQG